MHHLTDADGGHLSPGPLVYGPPAAGALPTLASSSGGGSLNAAKDTAFQADLAPKTVLLVDSSDANRVTTKWFLGNFGYAVESVATAEQALQLFNPSIHDIVITDNFSTGMTGGEMAHIIKLRSHRTPVLMYTSQIPADHSCLDLVIERPSHLLNLKEGIDRLVQNSR